VIESASVSFHETTYPGDISNGASKDHENLTMTEKEEDDTSWTLETENLSMPSNSSPLPKPSELEETATPEVISETAKELDQLLEEELIAPRKRRPPTKLKDYVTSNRVAIYEGNATTALAAKLSLSRSLERPTDRPGDARED
jgi:predicted AAA+ superfamily ATPase